MFWLVLVYVLCCAKQSYEDDMNSLNFFASFKRRDMRKETMGKDLISFSKCGILLLLPFRRR